MNRAYKIIVGLLAFGLSACSQGGAEAQPAPQQETPTNWQVEAAKSRISFSSDQGGEAFTGYFQSFDAQIKFDPSDLESSEVVVQVDMVGAEANDAERTGALPGKDWFSVKKFPQASFAAKRFTKLEGNKYEAEGNLTIRDVTRPLTLPFSLNIKDGVAVMNGMVSINRIDYEVGLGSWKSEDWVAHQVDINIDLVANAVN